jgi:hypothetical protein
MHFQHLQRKQLLQQQWKEYRLHWLQQQRQLRCVQFRLLFEFGKMRRTTDLQQRTKD